MHVISQRALWEFGRKHADATAPLRAWLKVVRHGRFQNLAELKGTFPSVDMVVVKERSLYVFNVGGNKYRLVAAIHFTSQKLFVRDILTHRSTTRGGGKNEAFGGFLRYESAGIIRALSRDSH